MKLDLDMPEEYDGRLMMNRMQQIIDMSLNDNEDELHIAEGKSDGGPSHGEEYPSRSVYMHYRGGDEDKHSSSDRKSRSHRPGTAKYVSLVTALLVSSPFDILGRSGVL